MLRRYSAGLIILLCLSLTTSAYADITRPNAACDSTPQTSVSSYSFSCTSTNPSPYLLCYITTNTNITTVSTVTYNGVGMTQRGASVGENAQGRSIYVYSLAGPATGSNTVQVTLSGTPIAWSKAICVSYTGVDQSTDWTTIHNINKTILALGTSISPSVTVNVVNSILAVLWNGGGGDPSASTNAQEVLDPVDAFHEPVAFENSSLTGQSTGSQSMTITTGAVSTVIAFAVALAPAAPTANYQLWPLFVF